VLVEAVLAAAELDDEVPGVGGAVRTVELAGAGVFESSLARVIEIFTSLGWMPNFSRVDETASERAPWKLSSLDWLKGNEVCPAADVLVSDENMPCM
jgi:hypothetical protein